MARVFSSGRRSRAFWSGGKGPGPEASRISILDTFKDSIEVEGAQCHDFRYRSREGFFLQRREVLLVSLARLLRVRDEHAVLRERSTPPFYGLGGK